MIWFTVYSKAYSLKFHNLTHPCFSTLGVLFQNRDIRQDKSDGEIMESYKWMTFYAMNFLNAFLKNDKESLNFLERRPEDNDLQGGLVSIKSKIAKEKKFSFEDFNETATDRNYTNLDPLYDSILNKHPSFKPEEETLNNLGLQLVFNPKTSEQGISVLLLSTKIYPESSNLFDSLAEAYLFAGENKMAITNFKKSLKLYPQNQNALNRLKELKKF
jgi:tetratricopeptide (TPR) repeat protein